MPEVGTSTDSQFMMMDITEFFWSHLHGALIYAQQQVARTEAHLYGVYSIILTCFCSFASVVSKFGKVVLVNFPQNYVIAQDADGRFVSLIPDFCIFLTRTLSNLTKNFSGRLAFIVEVKKSESNVPRRWRDSSDNEGLKRTNPTALHFEFYKHLPQVLDQARVALADDPEALIRAFLFIDCWFAYYELNNTLPDNNTVMENMESYCYVRPSPVLSEDWSAFSPEFLRALMMAVTRHEGFQITPHAMFQPPPSEQGETASGNVPHAMPPPSELEATQASGNAPYAMPPPSELEATQTIENLFHKQGIAKAEEQKQQDEAIREIVNDTVTELLEDEQKRLKRGAPKNDDDDEYCDKKSKKIRHWKPVRAEKRAGRAMRAPAREEAIIPSDEGQEGEVSEYYEDDEMEECEVEE
ncbi:hypothetical protein OF83DRAFT_1179476 [Amylostereum chailletii]|nr:hypothetical protein OF83DRAFT_1179476 [Amylostereum chailletii]